MREKDPTYCTAIVVRMCECWLLKYEGKKTPLIDRKSINFEGPQRLFFMDVLTCLSPLVCPSADAFSRDFQFIPNQALSNILPTGN